MWEESSEPLRASGWETVPSVLQRPVSPLSLCLGTVTVTGFSVPALLCRTSSSSDFRPVFFTALLFKCPGAATQHLWVCLLLRRPAVLLWSRRPLLQVCQQWESAGSHGSSARPSASESSCAASRDPSVWEGSCLPCRWPLCRSVSRRLQANL